MLDWNSRTEGRCCWLSRCCCRRRLFRSSLRARRSMRSRRDSIWQNCEKRSKHANQNAPKMQKQASVKHGGAVAFTSSKVKFSFPDPSIERSSTICDHFGRCCNWANKAARSSVGMASTSLCLLEQEKEHHERVMNFQRRRRAVKLSPWGVSDTRHKELRGARRTLHRIAAPR